MELINNGNDSEDYEKNPTSPEVEEKSTKSGENLLPSLSKERYEYTYNKFMIWRRKNNINSFSEKAVLSYFVDLSSKYKSSTLWSIYSMLRGTLVAKHDINIATYTKLKALLKKKSINYVAKKANVLTNDNIRTFIETAPNEIYLLIKTTLIFGICGCMRKSELYHVKLGDVRDVNSALIVNVPYTQSKNKPRQFVITDNFYSICKEYMNLRPARMTDKNQRFFLNYQKGKCTRQVVGINKFGRLVQAIARFLKLPHPETYTGHTYRRTSATIVAENAEGDLLALRSSYLHDSINKKIAIPKYIPGALPSTSGTQPLYGTLLIVRPKEEPEAEKMLPEEDKELSLQKYANEESCSRASSGNANVEEENYEIQDEECSIKIEAEELSEMPSSPLRSSSRNSVTTALPTLREVINSGTLAMSGELNESRWQNEDANESFFKSMCNIVRGLPGQKQAVIRSQVARIVLEADVNFQTDLETKPKNA